MINETLRGITSCPNLKIVLNNPGIQHSCSAIINTQAELNYFQIPEPWCGDIVNAPILVLSSNPSITTTEFYPNNTWTQKMINDFFVNRFKDRGELYSWVYNGQVLLNNGERGNTVAFWSGIRNRISEIIEREPIAGIDFCITEIVHCKSINEIGVQSALPTCTKLHLDRVMQLSNACVILAFGDKVKNFLGEVESYNNKPILYLPHPTSRVIRTIPRLIEAGLLTSNQVQYFRELVNNCKKKNAAVEIELPNESEVVEFIKLNTINIK